MWPTAVKVGLSNLGIFPKSLLKVDSIDMPITQNKLCNQKLQVHEGRSRKMLLDKFMFDQRDIYSQDSQFSQEPLFGLHFKGYVAFQRQLHSRCTKTYKHAVRSCKYAPDSHFSCTRVPQLRPACHHAYNTVLSIENFLRGRPFFEWNQ